MICKICFSASADCGGLPDPTDGMVEISPDTMLDATATYSCDTGFGISSGDEVRTCLANSSWSGEAATCARTYVGVHT